MRLKPKTARRLRNAAGLTLLGVGVVASRELSAFNCYVCETNNYCRDTSEGEGGRTTCVDPNQGWTNCSLGGGFCMWVMN